MTQPKTTEATAARLSQLEEETAYTTVRRMRSDERLDALEATAGKQTPEWYAEKLANRYDSFNKDHAARFDKLEATADRDGARIRELAIALGTAKANIAALEARLDT